MSDEPRDLTNYDAVTDDRSALGYGDDARASGERALRVAEHEGTKRTKPKRKPNRDRDKAWKSVKDAPHVATKNIYLLFYFSRVTSQRTIEDVVAYLHGNERDETKWPQTSKFKKKGIEIIVRQNSATAWEDLGNAVHEPGAIVIWWSHSDRRQNAKVAHVLRPMDDVNNESWDVTAAQLRSLTKTMNAKALVLLSCATKGMLGKSARDTAVVTNDSGADLFTQIQYQDVAIETFLMALIESKPLAECVQESSRFFAALTIDKDDRLVLSSGDGGMTITT